MTQETKATTCASKFQLGQIVAPSEAICTEFKALNNQALVEGERDLSAYAIDESKTAKVMWRQLPVDHHRARPQLDHLPVARRLLTPALLRAGCLRHGVFYCRHSFKEH